MSDNPAQHAESVACSCGRISVGMTVTENRNWNPDCPEHGVGTPWHTSPEQIERRNQQTARLRELQAKARAARAAHHDGRIAGENDA